MLHAMQGAAQHANDAVEEVRRLLVGAASGSGGAELPAAEALSERVAHAVEVVRRLTRTTAAAVRTAVGGADDATAGVAVLRRDMGKAAAALTAVATPRAVRRAARAACQARRRAARQAACSAQVVHRWVACGRPIRTLSLSACG